MNNVGCGQSKEEPPPSVNGVLINEDIEIKNSFITGTHIAHTGSGVEGNFQIGFYKRKCKKYEASVKRLSMNDRRRANIS